MRADFDSWTYSDGAARASERCQLSIARDRPDHEAERLSDLAERLFRDICDKGAPALREADPRLAICLRIDDKILLRRDAMGRIPLHWIIDDDRVIVDRSALALARKRGAVLLDESWLAPYHLTRSEKGTATPYQGVNVVPPGHMVSITGPGSPELEKWWEPDLSPCDFSFDEAVSQSEKLLDRAMAPALDAPLMLSAGVDSNLLLTRLVAQGRTPEAITGSPTVHAEPVGGATIDEFPIANAGFRTLGGDTHHRLVANPTGLREAIAWGFEAHERPLFNVCNLGWTDGCVELAAGLGHDVLLDGTAGNFTIGYDGEHPHVRLARERDWAGWIVAILRNGGRGIRWSLNKEPPEWLRWWRAPSSAKKLARQVRARRRNPFIKAELRRAIKARDLPYQAADRIGWPERRLSDFILHRDPAPHLHAARKRHGVQLYDPFTDPDFVQLALRIPDTLQHDGAARRRVQRAMLDPRLPQVVREGRARGLQGADWRAAAQRDVGLMARIIDRLEDGHRGSGQFDVPSLRRALERWPASGWDDEDQINAYRVFFMRTLGTAAFAQWVADQ